jgi:hypothetical protein
MTLTIDFPAELEARIYAEAQRQGITPEEFVLQVLEQAMHADLAKKRTSA